MKNFIMGMFIGSMVGGIIGTVASDEIYDAKKKAMKIGKRILKKCNIM